MIMYVMFLYVSNLKLYIHDVYIYIPYMTINMKRLMAWVVVDDNDNR